MNFCPMETWRSSTSTNFDWRTLIGPMTASGTHGSTQKRSNETEEAGTCRFGLRRFVYGLLSQFDYHLSLFPFDTSYPLTLYHFPSIFIIA
jgi:hypothetical protein